jgi:hypothetical protein
MNRSFYCNLLLLVLLAHECRGRALISAVDIDIMRGGSTKSSTSPYSTLANAIRTKFEGPPDLKKLERALGSLSSAQQTLKGLDGIAHEAYQRTHRNTGDVSGASGRAKRSAARAGSTADALLAAELCELIDKPDVFEDELADPDNVNGTLAGRELVAHVKQLKLDRRSNISWMVLYEPMYSGGAGLNHGGIEDLANGGRSKRGRMLVIMSDSSAEDLSRTLDVLDTEPLQISLNAGLVANEVASVQPVLYRAAGRLVQELEPLLQKYNSSDMAIHFIGRSLAGGVASLAATILDGSLPLPSDNKKSKKRKSRDVTEPDKSMESSNTTVLNTTVLEGFGRGRSSAMVLGVPPCLSANVKAAFVKSIIYGDDIVCRTTHVTLERLMARTKNALKGGVLGQQLGWMADTVSLTVSSMSRHAQGSEGEEERLSVPGQAFLIRPRRLGGTCSMHEVGGQKGGREALRAAVLWQLNDILLSASLWKHHQLDSYIHGLDRVQLRGIDDEEGEQLY